jgi:GAF domain-containing protein
VVFLALSAGVPALLHWVLGLAVPLRVWLEIAAGLFVLTLGFVLGQRFGFARSDPNVDRYAEHTSDALETLQKVMLGAIAPVKIRDFVQEGLFEPAHAILANETRGQVRFSVLVPDGSDFVMRHALGHDVESRRAFTLPIHESFAGLAFNEREAKYAEDTQNDDRFKPHPRARPGREYRSIVAVPLLEGDEVFGVFVAVAQHPRAFSRADRTYIRVLGAIMDVARATGTIRRAADEEEDD